MIGVKTTSEQREYSILTFRPQNCLWLCELFGIAITGFSSLDRFTIGSLDAVGPFELAGLLTDEFRRAARPRRFLYDDSNGIVKHARAVNGSRQFARSRDGGLFDDVYRNGSVRRLVAGSLAERLGAPVTVRIGGAVCILGAFVFGLRLPALKKEAREIIVALRINGGDPAEEMTDPTAPARSS